MNKSTMASQLKCIIMKGSFWLTPLLTLLAIGGFYFGSQLKLKLSLTDLLPEDHLSVIQFNELTEIVGGVGFLSVVLTADDHKSHLEIAPALVEAYKKDPSIRSAFYQREERFFSDRMLYYFELPDLKKLEQGIGNEIRRSKRKIFDIGLFDEETSPKEPEVDPKLKEMAKKSADVTPYLLSKDQRDLVIMIKPSFDSMDMAGNRQLIETTEQITKSILPKNVSYALAGRYFHKVHESEVIQTDILLLGGSSILIIALIIFLYLRSIRGLAVIFIPVMIGLGITAGLTYFAVGHINVITGFLMGIVSGLGVDYAIHMLLRLRLELREPSSNDPSPVWRTIASSGHSVFVGAMAAAVSFYFLTGSSFKAFSEFGFICGTGITTVFICLMLTFPALIRWFKIENEFSTKKEREAKWLTFLPSLNSRSRFWLGSALTVALLVAAFRVGFEYDFDKMMEYSKTAMAVEDKVNEIYGRSIIPSVLAAKTKEEAVGVENILKEKYMPSIVGSVVSGATIIPDYQKEKVELIAKIDTRIRALKNSWIEKSLDMPAKTVRSWATAKPFTFIDLPEHLQDLLRGLKQTGYLLYLYPNIPLSNYDGVMKYAAMIHDIQTKFPNLLTGSDTVVFAEILNLIRRDGAIILAVIFLSVGFFIWINVRRIGDTLYSYLPLLIALPVGMGIMEVFDVKFNIFNVAIIPTFVAMGIDVPIHIVHRAHEIKSGFRAAKDLAASIHLALMTAAVGFGVLIFARAGVLRSLGWVALLGTVAIWWIGLVILPAFLEYKQRKQAASPGEVFGSKINA